jgi:hypothetical protein
MVLTACDVCTTHTGLLMIVVAEPAYIIQRNLETRKRRNGPAIKPVNMDSRVLSAFPPLLERRIVSLERS